MMKVAIAHETKEKNVGSYHALNDATTASLCGSLNEESQFAANIVQVLSKGEAEQRGLSPCGRCSFILDQ